MSKTVLLFRHGKSDAGLSGGTDHDRPLNERGRLDVSLVGDVCTGQGLNIDRIVCSTAVRTYSTAVLFAQRFGYDLNEIQLERTLYLAEPLAYIQAIIQHSQSERGQSDSMMLVGHNPGISGLASAWTRSDVDLPTAAVAHIQLPIDDWRDLSVSTQAQLIQLVIPREL